MHAPERRQREDERGQEAVKRTEAQGSGVNRGNERQRDPGPEDQDREIGQGGSDRETGQNAEGRDQHHLGEPEREDGAAGSTERLQHREAGALALHRGLDGIADPDPSDDQRRKPDEGQELREAAEVAVEFGRNAIARLDLPTRLGERSLGVAHETLQRRVVVSCRYRRPRGRSGS